MHWTLGKARRQSRPPLEAAAHHARLTRMAATIALLMAVLAMGGAVAVEAIDQDQDEPANCTALALTGYLYLYHDGVISHSEYESLRQDAIDDELADTGDCVPVDGSRL